MDDTLVVSGGETARHLRGIADGFARGKRTTRKTLAERLTFQKLRHRKKNSVVVSEVEDREDVGMREGRDRFGLTLEARTGTLVYGEVAR